MGFEDLDDLSELDEIPPFEEDLTLPGFEEPGGGGGVSRTFKIIGAFMVLAVIGVVGVLVYVLLQGDDEISSFDQTATSIAQTNAAVQVAANNTSTAVIEAVQATGVAIQTMDALSTRTADALAIQRQQTATQEALNAVASQTAAAQASQTAAAQEALDNATPTQYAVEHQISGQLMGKDSQPAQAGIPIFLYTDNGDGVFVAPAGTPPPVPEVVIPDDTTSEVPSVVLPGGEDTATEATAEPAGEGAATEAAAEESIAPTLINPGQPVAGTITSGERLAWVFTGNADDSVSVTATTTVVELQLTLRLVGPDGAEIVSQGPAANVTVGTMLTAAGDYTIELISAAGEGDYTLELQLVSSESTSGGEMSYQNTTGIVLVAQTAGETPTPTTPPSDADELFSTITTNPDGTFNFDNVPDGTYFLVLDPSSLTPAQLDQLGLEPGSEPVVLQVIIPGIGEPITFNPVATTPATLSPEDISATETAIATRTPPTPTAGGPSATPGGIVTLTPTAEELADTGGFDGMNLDGSSGLTVLAIAAAGLIAVVFIARKLRTAA